MSSSSFKRKITRNLTNKKVEENVAEIIKQMVKMGYSYADISRKAGVAPTTVSNWVKNGRADANVIDRLIEEVKNSKADQSVADNSNSDIFENELWAHIKSLQELGFEVTLTPIK